MLLFVGPSKEGGCPDVAIDLEVVADNLFKSYGRREGSGSIKSCTTF